MTATLPSDTEPRWDLSRLFAGGDDPQLELDFVHIRHEAKALRARYLGQAANLSPAQLRQAIERFEAHYNALGKIGTFASLSFSADTANEKTKALFTRIRTELTAIHNEVQFFKLELQALPQERFEAFSRAPELASYRYYLEKLRKALPHTLSEAEERLLAVRDVTGVQAWAQLYTEITAGLTVSLELPDGPRTMNVESARALRADPDRRVREAATRAVFAAHAAEAHVLTYVFNTIYEDHHQACKLRGYDSPIAPTLANEDLSPAIVEALMATTEANYPLAQRYYRAKAKVLGLEGFASHDIVAPYSQVETRVTYAEAQQTVLECFGAFAPRFEEIARGFFDGGYIDVPSAPGKQGGAFCHGIRPGLHPYVLLNFTHQQDDVMTLAHELGHGIHFLLAGERQSVYNYYPILPLAETASTFAEVITYEHLLAREEDPKRRLQLLAARVEDAVSTIMRQVMYTRWEQRAHDARAQGVVSREDFCRLWEAENAKLYGDAVARGEGDKWGWITIPHLIKYRFYCYSYAFGQLLVYALYRKYQAEGAAFVPRLLELLAAGGSAPANEILKRIGIDIQDPGFWQGGFDYVGEMIEAFEQEARAQSLF